MADWQDDGALAAQYADASNLAARQVLFARFSTAERSRREWLFDQMESDQPALPADADVLSLGAGHGVLWAANCERIPDGWDVTVTDAFQGMVMDAMETLEECQREFNFDVVDARDIPYPNDSFDVITANHVLQHLDAEGRERAIAEVRRVLKPDGTLYAATTGESHLAELHDVLSGFGSVPHENGFSLENGTDQLRAQFGDVDLRRFENSLSVTSAAPLVAYALSLPGFDDEDGREMETAFRERIGDDGFDVAMDVGVFVAR
ncbi:class I SAM-dependent methyltransferase [Halobacterium zhouii]|uniref:class I SAM-dependent methyltransferase n=1 Tax=Halobacterium zhouii TaxID=2902624 RepID=UPI001E3266EC|nr:class I SAM-dependent methyltransferase [Halobacterium zhouii]